MKNFLKKSLIALAACLMTAAAWADEFTLDFSTQSTSHETFPINATLPQFEYSGNASIAEWKLLLVDNGASFSVTNVTGATISAIKIEGVCDNNSNKSTVIKLSDGTTELTTGSSSWNNRKSTSMTTKNLSNINKLKCDAGTVYTFTNSGYKVGMRITFVYTGGTPPVTVDVESVSLDKESLSLELGASATLTAAVSPANATNKKITWASSDASIASVDQNGKVTANKVGGPVTVTVTTDDGGFSAECAVTVTSAPERPVTSISIPATETLTIGGSKTLTVTYSPDNANAGKELSWESSDESVATVDQNGKVSGVKEGTATVTATSTTNPSVKASCLVTVQAAAPLPVTDLTTHTPEIYEDPAGYNTPLVKFDNREYEVFYCGKGKIGGSGSTYPLLYTDASGNEISNGTKVKDGWCKYDIKSCDSDGGKSQDEFSVSSRGDWKTTADNYILMQVKGYDRFRFFAAEKKDNDPNQELHVFIDDMEKEMPMTHSTSATVRTFDITPDEHVIKITATGSSNQYIYGWSLRVTDNPIVRYLSGPKTQTVYQTKDIQTVAYRVRRAASHRLTWIGNEIPGITLETGANDSVFVRGIADAPAGTYIYKVEALDADGAVASTEQGMVTIQTHIFDARLGNDFSSNIAEQIKPLNFVFYASNSSGLSLNCDIEGLSLVVLNDSTCSLTGTPAVTTTEGDHTYTVSIAGGNSISGTITIVVPDPIFEPVADAKVRDNASITFGVTVRHAASVSQSGLPEGFTLTYDQTTDIASISGIPAVGSPYPRTFEYTLTATPRYAGKQTVTATGKLIVIDPNAKAILLVCKDLKNAGDDPVAAYFESLKYDLTLRKQDEIIGASVEAFDMILISDNADADNEGVLNIIRSSEKPVLNMKGFTYATGRLNWGEPNNGTVNTETGSGLNIYVERANHPVFKNFGGLAQGDEIKILTRIDKRGIMPIAVNLPGTYCLATALTQNINDYYKDGEPQTAIHEIPSDMRGGAKYICLPIASASLQHLSDQGKKLLSNIADYLLSTEDADLELPYLEISEFSVNGEKAAINQGDNLIELKLTDAQYKSMDSLRAAVPQITIADPDFSHVAPAAGTALDLRYTTFIPKTFIVTDYISRRAYSFVTRIIRTEGIEDVYEIGQWVNIFDIYGRKIAATNDDIYHLELPGGVYMIVTESGNTFKIVR